MRFALTAFNNKVIDSEDYDFENNKKLLIICPNKNCNSPLTYVRTIEGKRYFRHLGRKQKELQDPNFQCEQRAKGITSKSMRSHNKIVEQTTIQQFQKNFYNIIGLAFGWDKEVIETARFLSTQTKFQKLIENIQTRATKEIIKIKKDNPEGLRTANINKKKYNDEDWFDKFLIEYKENGQIIKLQKYHWDFFLDPSLQLIASYAEVYFCNTSINI
ncbi:hypothetical protein [Prochlorococcus sp. MIT 0916]|uniref:hypothetical protein n=1 Tax=Prochlorococcus sp. MIT 0916 TaxID=3082521 RepID=UPI0039B69C9F